MFCGEVAELEDTLGPTCDDGKLAQGDANVVVGIIGIVEPVLFDIAGIRLGSVDVVNKELNALALE